MPPSAWATVTRFVGPDAQESLALFLFATAVPLFAASRLRGARPALRQHRRAGDRGDRVQGGGASPISIAPTARARLPPRSTPPCPTTLPLFIYRVYEGSLSYHYRKPNLYVYDPAALKAATLDAAGDDWVLAPIGSGNGNPPFFPASFRSRNTRSN